MFGNRPWTVSTSVADQPSWSTGSAIILIIREAPRLWTRMLRLSRLCERTGASLSATEVFAYSSVKSEEMCAIWP